jgi:hypothetical protein
MGDHPQKTFLIEAYVPQLDEAVATAFIAGITDAIEVLREGGSRLEWLGALSAGDDETLMSIIGATDADLVGDLLQRAGVGSARVVEVRRFGIGSPGR